MTTALPDTFTTLHDLLVLAEAEWHMDRDDTVVSPSATNTLCRRQLAYTLTLTTPTDEPDPVTTATVGSLLHKGVATLWDDDPYTIGTEMGVPGGGTCDVLQHPKIVRDLKSVGRSKFDRWHRNDGPPDEVWDQGMVYAGRMGADEDGWLVVIDALCRESGRTATYTRPFDAQQYGAAEAGLARLQARYGVGNPDDAPADRTGRGDWLCDSCPWATRCLADDDRPNVTELEPDEAEAAAAEYAHWNAIALDAKAKAEQARTALRGTTGTFGQWRVSWSQRAGRHVEAYDVKPSTVISVKAVKP